MGKNSLTIDNDIFEDLLKRFGSLSNEIENTAETVLKKSVDFMNPKLEESVQNNNLPKKGKYSKGKLKKSIIKDQKVIKNGVVYEIDFGFDMKIAPHSIFIAKGTPKMARNNKLYNVLYGKKLMEELHEFQKKIMWDNLSYLKNNR